MSMNQKDGMDRQNVCFDIDDKIMNNINLNYDIENLTNEMNINNNNAINFHSISNSNNIKNKNTWCQLSLKYSMIWLLLFIIISIGLLIIDITFLKVNKILPNAIDISFNGPDIILEVTTKVSTSNILALVQVLPSIYFYILFLFV